jgi:hypothetical protein
MAWDAAAGSSIFRAWMRAALGPQAGFTGGWGTPAAGAVDGAFNVALYDNTPDPDKSETDATLTCYDTGEWDAANEKTDTSGNANWPAGGIGMTAVAISEDPSEQNPAYPTGGPELLWPLAFRADDTTNLGLVDGTVTLDDVYGDLLYFATASNTPVNQGAAFHYFGGINQVSAGTFTIIWHARGVMVQVV